MYTYEMSKKMYLSLKRDLETTKDIDIIKYINTNFGIKGKCVGIKIR